MNSQPARFNSPWWRTPVNGLVFLLGKLGAKRLRLDLDSLLSLSRRATGLSDFGPGDFQTPLLLLLQDFQKHSEADPLGRALFGRNLRFLLETRLRATQALKDYPAILQVPVEKPLFILGLPRTGTTFLQGLLSQVACLRSYINWQGMSPAPPPSVSSKRNIQSRIAHSRQRNSFIYKLSPGFITAHELHENEPDECNHPMMTAFQSFLFGVYFHSPDYLNYLFQCDFRDAYYWHKVHLQMLAFGLENKSWVLKGPAHLGSLTALLQAYPDARMVFTHRDPADSLPSLASLLRFLHQVFASPPPAKEAGKFTVEYLEKILAAGQRTRTSAQFPSAQALDLKYHDLVADPVGTVLKILGHFKYEEDPGLVSRLEAFCQANKQHRKGKHHYSLEEFGLESGEIRQRFAFEWEQSR